MTPYFLMSAPTLGVVRSIVHPFASQLSFLDPQLTKQGKPYGPERYKEIVKERFIITKNVNTSYDDTGKMTPLERRYVLDFIEEDLKRTKEILDNSQRDAKNSKLPVPRFSSTR